LQTVKNDNNKTTNILLSKRQSIWTLVLFLSAAVYSLIIHLIYSNIIDFTTVTVG